MEQAAVCVELQLGVLQQGLEHLDGREARRGEQRAAGMHVEVLTGEQQAHEGGVVALVEHDAGQEAA